MCTGEVGGGRGGGVYSSKREMGVRGIAGGVPGWKERRRMTWFGGTNGEDVGERLGYAGGCDVTGG